jgi:formylmethanofuran dehydrogenase subunit B
VYTAEEAIQEAVQLLRQARNALTYPGADASVRASAFADVADSYVRLGELLTVREAGLVPAGLVRVEGVTDHTHVGQSTVIR